jgi:hypothetical protein
MISFTAADGKHFLAKVTGGPVVRRTRSERF